MVPGALAHRQEQCPKRVIYLFARQGQAHPAFKARPETAKEQNCKSFVLKRKAGNFKMNVHQTGNAEFSQPESQGGAAAGSVEISGEAGADVRGRSAIVIVLCAILAAAAIAAYLVWMV